MNTEVSILVIDDDPATRELLKIELALAGFRVLTGASLKTCVLDWKRANLRYFASGFISQR